MSLRQGRKGSDVLFFASACTLANRLKIMIGCCAAQRTWVRSLRCSQLARGLVYAACCWWAYTGYCSLRKLSADLWAHSVSVLPTHSFFCTTGMTGQLSMPQAPRDTLVRVPLHERMEDVCLHLVSRLLCQGVLPPWQGMRACTDRPSAVNLAVNICLLALCADYPFME